MRQSARHCTQPLRARRARARGGGRRCHHPRLRARRNGRDVRRPPRRHGVLPHRIKDGKHCDRKPLLLPKDVRQLFSAPRRTDIVICNRLPFPEVFLYRNKRQVIEIVILTLRVFSISKERRSKSSASLLVRTKGLAPLRRAPVNSAPRCSVCAPAYPLHCFPRKPFAPANASPLKSLRVSFSYQKTTEPTAPLFFGFSG